MTISEYLSSKKDKTLKTILTNCSLDNVSINLFFKVFENVERKPDAVMDFIKDPNNAYELSVLGYRANHKDKFDAYNGKSNYQGVNCTLGASHSKFHG